MVVYIITSIQPLNIKDDRSVHITYSERGLEHLLKRQFELICTTGRH